MAICTDICRARQNMQGTKQDLIEGDPKYMSPELLRNQFDRPADIFRWVRFFACQKKCRV